MGYYKLLVSCLLILASCVFCNKDPKITPAETGTVTDIEGNVYKTVKIGKQWWMTENLKVTKYSNFEGITQIIISDSLHWKNSVNGAYCIYDVHTNSTGLLYNWYAVTDARNIAPVGWHVPSDEEWKQLEQYLGMSNVDADKYSWRGTNEGDKLKIEGPQVWVKYSSVWGTNESGFNALPGNCCMFDGITGTPYGIGFTGFWWSSSKQNDKQALYRYLDYKNSNIFRFYGPFTYGFSIRCVKD